MEGSHLGGMIAPALASFASSASNSQTPFAYCCISLHHHLHQNYFCNPFADLQTSTFAGFTSRSNPNINKTIQNPPSLGEVNFQSHSYLCLDSFHMCSSCIHMCSTCELIWSTRSQQNRMWDRLGGAVCVRSTDSHPHTAFPLGFTNLTSCWFMTTNIQKSQRNSHCQHAPNGFNELPRTKRFKSDEPLDPFHENISQRRPGRCSANILAPKQLVRQSGA